MINTLEKETYAYGTNIFIHDYFNIKIGFFYFLILISLYLIFSSQRAKGGLLSPSFVLGISQFWPASLFTLYVVFELLKGGRNILGSLSVMVTITSIVYITQSSLSIKLKNSSIKIKKRFTTIFTRILFYLGLIILTIYISEFGLIAFKIRFNLESNSASTFLIYTYTQVLFIANIGYMHYLKYEKRSFLSSLDFKKLNINKLLEVVYIIFTLIITLTKGSKSSIIDIIQFILIYNIFKIPNAEIIKLEISRLIKSFKVKSKNVKLILTALFIAISGYVFLIIIFKLLFDLDTSIAIVFALKRFTNQFDQLNGTISKLGESDLTGIYNSIFSLWLQPFLERLGYIFQYQSLSDAFNSGDGSKVASNMIWEFTTIYGYLNGALLCIIFLSLISLLTNTLFYSKNNLINLKNNYGLSIIRLAFSPLVFGPYGAVIWGGSFIQGIIVCFSLCTACIILTIIVLSLK